MKYALSLVAGGRVKTPITANMIIPTPTPTPQLRARLWRILATGVVLETLRVWLRRLGSLQLYRARAPS